VDITGELMLAIPNQTTTPVDINLFRFVEIRDARIVGQIVQFHPRYRPVNTGSHTQAAHTGIKNQHPWTNIVHDQEGLRPELISSFMAPIRRPAMVVANGMGGCSSGVNQPASANSSSCNLARKSVG